MASVLESPTLNAVNSLLFGWPVLALNLGLDLLCEVGDELEIVDDLAADGCFAFDAKG